MTPCTCMTKTPELRFHKPTCEYRQASWPNRCPLQTYDCKCRGEWCRLLGRNLNAEPPAGKVGEA